MKQRSKNILITGVSTGIGLGACREFIKKGYTVYGSVRKETDALRLQSELGAQYKPLIFDVTNESQVSAAVDKVSAAIGHEGLACLINNSGIAEGGPLQYQTQEDFEKHFYVNVFGLMRVTRSFLPLLGADRNAKFSPGRIINISSVAGKVASPFAGAYAGSKHAVEGISHSLRRELQIYDIDVIIIGPGSVNTPIWDKGIKLEKYSDSAYAGVLQGFGDIAKKGGEEGLTIEFLGKKIADIFEKKNPKVRYAYVGQMMTRWIIPRLLPTRWFDRIIKKKLEA